MAASRWLSKAVSSPTVAFLSWTSSRGENSVQPDRVATDKTNRLTANGPTTPLFIFLSFPWALRQHNIQCLPHLSNPDQLDSINRIKLGQVPFRQQTAFESHLCRFTNPHFSLTDGPHFTTEPHLAQHQ